MNPTPLYVHGYGAISAAGLDAASLYQATLDKTDIPLVQKEYPLGEGSINYPGRPVDTKALRSLLPRAPRLRRSSNVTKFAMAAALQAIPEERAARIKAHDFRLGIIVSFMNGCVNYSCRFYEEVLAEPAHASPLIFPETVFNAPASHVASYFESDGPCYTLIGDSATWLSAVTVARDWLATDQVDGCLIICAEELDRLTSEALHLYSRQNIATEGAAALYLERNPADIQLSELHGPFPYNTTGERNEALAEAVATLENSGTLVDGLTGVSNSDHMEVQQTPPWSGPTLSPGQILGDGMGIKCGFQTIVALEALNNGSSRTSVLAAGTNQHAFSAVFTK
ncbi:hypothetical protein V2O64_10925 [Verrucomicrobiaceae bacterium 227]